MPSRSTITRKVEHRFISLKNHLVKWLEHIISNGLCGRFCGTSDIWTAKHQRICYSTLTLHFIAGWVFYSIVIAFPVMTYPHTGEHIANVLFESLKEWKVINHFLSLTLDNASNNDTCIEQFKELFETNEIEPFMDNEFLQTRCGCHIFNLIAQDGLLEVAPIIENIRHNSKNTKLPKQNQFFEQMVVQENNKELSNSARPSLDVTTRWNSTNDMILTAEPYKKQFNLLALQGNTSFKK